MLNSTKSKISILKSLFHEKVKPGNNAIPIIYCLGIETNDKDSRNIRRRSYAFLGFDPDKKKLKLRKIRKSLNKSYVVQKYMIYYINKD